MNDNDAVFQLKKGEIGGLETLVCRYQAKAVQAAYLITRDWGQAEDIVQTAFIRVYERIHQFDNTRPFWPWFLRIVTNQAVKTAKRDSRLVFIQEWDGEEVSIIGTLLDQLPELENEIEANEIRSLVWSAVEKLSPREREVVVLRYFTDLSGAEISTALQIPSGTLKWRLFQARKVLKSILSLILSILLVPLGLF